MINALKVHFIEDSIFNLKFKEETKFNVSFGEVREIPLNPYTGEYEVDPNFDTQILETANKTLVEDVTINPIEVSRVSNPFGGRTVYIGGEING